MLSCRGQLPARRSGHATIAVGPHLIVHGGTNNQRLLGDVSVLHTGTCVWSRPSCEGTQPSPRMRTSMVYFEGGAELIVFGGGPWQCIEVTSQASELDGDMYRVGIHAVTSDPV
uniref:Uncharacterized protein n=1 Tax=Octactis speculum TaxID=3111310 RepID=A0A7S2DU64_9STRA